MPLDKVEKYGTHERDRPIQRDELMKLRRAITESGDWKAEGSRLYIDDEVLLCSTAEQAELIALLRNGMLQVLNDSLMWRKRHEELSESYQRLTASFRALWERTQDDN